MLHISDLELRLALPNNSDGATSRHGLNRTYPPDVIVVDDDDDCIDDNNAGGKSNIQTINFLDSSNSLPRELSEEDLELRLGLSAYSQSSLRIPSGTHISRSARYEYDENKKPKLKTQTSGKDIKLQCTICMDTMKEETSTTCGHVFCRLCITNAVISQKKCPTCRTKISLQSIHRIYLPASTS